MTTRLEHYTPWAVAAFRIVVGFLFMCHGTSTLFAWPVEPFSGQTASFGAWPSWWSGIIELVVGVLIITGVGTRIAAFIGSGTMAVAYFWKHQPDGFLPIQNDGDSSVLLCWALLLLVFVGPGRAALGKVLTRQPGRGGGESADHTAPDLSPPLISHRP
ncbi:DoxX family protein [Rhodococcus artemisiae]|uniref:DoxX family protein n=1 Tax=Rhodococcus artemisiae TaxID=714159 RepID=A0ABU7L791_9NOCA|nr:DoxX family protein [Rhodococcus artemisiae]MEE2057410.1 DoxX family protein [Rhodococcus artemisiae]